MASSKGPGRCPFFHFLLVFLAQSLNAKNGVEGQRAFLGIFTQRQNEGQRAFFLVQHRNARAGERHQLVGHQVDEQVRHRAVQAGVGRGWGQRVGVVRVPDAEGDLDGLGVDEGRAAGQRDAADPRGGGGEGAQRAGEVLRVMPCRHVACVACFQLVVQALHQLILGSGGDYLHACLYTRILTRTAKENYSSSAYINTDTGGIAFCSAKPCKSYYSSVYIEKGNSSFQRKTVQKCY